MGAFYGSAQVRSEDRDRVKAVAGEVARQQQIRMLIGPVLGGWIGVYPEGSGQDQNVSREIAQRIKGDVLHFLVHDDDICAYWLYRDGKPIDSFHSWPGYFGNENRAEEESMVGNLDAFLPLIADRAEELRPLLIRDEPKWRMASHRLDSFAKVLGISNALTSYEYLKEDDHQGIKGWHKFEEIPADAIADAKAQKRRAKELLKSEVKRLKAEGQLLDRKLSRDEMPSACGLAQDLFVAWADFRKDTVSFDLYKAPRRSPEPVPLDTSGITWTTVSDAQGRRVAMAARGRVQVWDVAATWTHVCEIAAPEGVSGLAISADGKLVAHSSQTQTVVTDVASRRHLLEIPDHRFEQAMFHPSGEWLAVGRADCALISMHKEPHWRPLVQKPKPGAEWPLATAARLLKVDVGTLIERSSQLDENFISIAREFQSGFESPSVVEARLEKHREKQAAKFAQMQADWAAIQRGEPPRPEPVQGTWSVGFSRDGRWFWRGTAWGLFIYEWSAIRWEKATELPDPTWSFELPSINEQRFQMVYAIVEEPDAQAVVFGGMTGRLYRLDLKSGAVRELIKLPGDCHIQTLDFTNDGATLGIVAQAFPLSTDATEYLEVGTIWEVWNYPRLRDGGAVANEAD